MSLLERALGDGREWTTVRDSYTVTRKPRGRRVEDVPTVPFAPMEAIPEGGSYLPSFTNRAPGEIRSGTYFERGDLLVAKITPSFENGKQALVHELDGEFGYATTEVIPLQPRSSEADPRFLFYYLLHPDVRGHVAGRMEGATGRRRVPEQVLLDLPMPAFDKESQGAIASILEQVQQASRAALELVRTLAELKQATMQTLFTRGLRGEAQKETEIGPVPESWEVVPFESIRHRLQYGTSARCSHEPVGTPVLRIPNVLSGRVDTSDLKYAELAPAVTDKYRLEAGDLLFVRTNGVRERLGTCAVYDETPREAAFASYLIRAKIRLETAHPRFLAHFLGSSAGTSLVAERATPAADGKFNLNTGAIDSIPVPVPPELEEQAEIASVLDTIDGKIDLHRRKSAVLEELFRALLHKLMTGEIRVVDLDLSVLPSGDREAA